MPSSRGRQSIRLPDPHRAPRGCVRRSRRGPSVPPRGGTRCHRTAARPRPNAFAGALVDRLIERIGVLPSVPVHPEAVFTSLDHGGGEVVRDDGLPDQLEVAAAVVAAGRMRQKRPNPVGRHSTSHARGPTNRFPARCGLRLRTLLNLRSQGQPARRGSGRHRSSRPAHRGQGPRGGVPASEPGTERARTHRSGAASGRRRCRPPRAWHRGRRCPAGSGSRSPRARLGGPLHALHRRPCRGSKRDCRGAPRSRGWRRADDMAGQPRRGQASSCRPGRHATARAVG